MNERMTVNAIYLLAIWKKNRKIYAFIMFLNQIQMTWTRQATKYTKISWIILEKWNSLRVS